MKEDFTLPCWATHRSDGNYMEIGAQLCTRDGRRLGNGYVDHIEDHGELGKLAAVVTDMRNTFKVTIR